MRIAASWTHTYEFGCGSAACAPPNRKGTGGTGGSIKGQTKGPTGAQVVRMKVVKHKSIPNVSDERLLDSLKQIHDMTHEKAGIYAHSGTRRQLIEQGMKGKQISQELIKRGHPRPTCKFCAPNEFPTDPAPVIQNRKKSGGSRH